MNVCAVHWGAATSYSESDLELLADTERSRLSTYANYEDRKRFVSATLLLRRVVGQALQVPPGAVHVDRRCRSCGRHHGRPRLPGTGLWASITHAGDVVGVAVSAAGPVGLDVEPTPASDLLTLASAVCAPGEVARSSMDVLHYWTRKESLVKATGDGLHADLTRLRVTPPGEEPRLRTYGGRPGLVAQMGTLSVIPGYVACAAVITTANVEFHEKVGFESS